MGPPSRLRLACSGNQFFRHRIAAPQQLGVDPQYALANWSDGGAVEHDVTARPETPVYCANYQIRHRATSGVTSGRGTVTLIPRSESGYYAERSLLRIKAEPADGTTFQRWTGVTNFSINGQSVFTPEATLEVTTANLNYQANFGAAAAQTIETEPAGRTLVIDGITYISPARMDWAVGSSHTITLTATQSEGNNTVRHEFQQWEDGSKDLTRTIRAGAAGTVYKASFLSKYLLTLRTLGSGTVSVDPGASDTFYEAGSTVQLTATPGAGVGLRYWLGDLTGATLSLPLTMNEQKVITAFFAPPIAYRILHSASYIANPTWNATGTVVAPGEIITIFGDNIGPASLMGGTVTNGKLDTQLGGVTLSFDNLRHRWCMFLRIRSAQWCLTASAHRRP